MLRVLTFRQKLHSLLHIKRGSYLMDWKPHHPLKKNYNVHKAELWRIITSILSCSNPKPYEYILIYIHTPLLTFSYIEIYYGSKIILCSINSCTFFFPFPSSFHFFSFSVFYMFLQMLQGMILCYNPQQNAPKKRSWKCR